MTNIGFSICNNLPWDRVSTLGHTTLRPFLIPVVIVDLKYWQLSAGLRFCPSRLGRTHHLAPEHIRNIQRTFLDFSVCPIAGSRGFDLRTLPISICPVRLGGRRPRSSQPRSQAPANKTWHCTKEAEEVVVRSDTPNERILHSGLEGSLYVLLQFLASSGRRWRSTSFGQR